MEFKSSQLNGLRAVLNKIGGLAYIKEEGGELRIGAMTREADIDHSELIRTRYGADFLPAEPRSARAYAAAASSSENVSVTMRSGCRPQWSR